MELANHSASFPELPGIPTLRLSFPYACVMKFLPFHGNRTGIATQAGPELWTESITHVCLEGKAKASLPFWHHSDLPGGRPLRHLMSPAQGKGVCASPWSLRGSVHCQMDLIPSVATWARTAKPQVSAQRTNRKHHFQKQCILLSKPRPHCQHYVCLLIAGSFDLSCSLKRQLTSVLTDDLIQMPN